MSPSTACCVGRSFRRWIGTTGEQLLDRPAVGNRLEQREVAEVRVRQHLVQVLEILGDFLELLRDALQLAADRPVECFGVHALFEREISAAEQVERHVERLLRVVEALLGVARRDAVVGFGQVDERLLQLARGAVGSDSLPNSDTPSTLNTSTL